MLGSFLFVAPILRADDISKSDPDYDPWAVPKTKVAIHLLPGFAEYPGVSDKGVSAGFELLIKDFDADKDGQYVSGNWTMGLLENLVFGTRELTTVQFYAGYGLADQNRLSAGVLLGVGLLNQHPNTGFFGDTYDVGGMFGVQMSYEIPVIGRFFFCPIATISVSAITNVPLIYTGGVALSYISPFRLPRR